MWMSQRNHYCKPVKGRICPFAVIVLASGYFIFLFLLQKEGADLEGDA